MDTGTSKRETGISTTVEQDLRAIVGAQFVRGATENDVVAGVRPQLVVEPANEKELTSVLRIGNDVGVAVIPRGGGTKLGWGNPPARADLVVSTSRLDKILEHAWADLTVSVEAGCTIQRLQDALAQHGQRLALDALWPERATVGGVLSTNDSGALRLRFGALRELILGVTLALPDGTIASSGGRVVKNVAGYELQKLAAGALGTLGVIIRAVFRVHPLPKLSRTLSVSKQSLQDAQQTMDAIQDSKLAHNALQLRVSSNAPPTVDILFEGTEAGIEAQLEQCKKLFQSPSPTEVLNNIWSAREALWDNSAAGLITKFSVLPARIAHTLEFIQCEIRKRKLNWSAVVQATGLALLRLDGLLSSFVPTLHELRAQLEKDSGSLVILQRPAGLPSIDSWGNAGDALPLMRALKHQFDPQNTVNPGRFVGGI